MRIDPSNDGLNSTPMALVSHKGNVVGFSIVSYRKNTFARDVGIFDQINDYWSSLPMETQDRIFEIYSETMSIFDGVIPKEMILSRLQEKVKELIELHDLETIQMWMGFKGQGIDIPPESAVPIQYVHNPDTNTSRSKTYIRADYVGLVSLVIVLRTMVPIWGEYTASIRKGSENVYKEMLAFRLLDTSNIFQTAPMMKLSEYVEEIVVSSDRSSHNNALNGIPRSDYPRWMLAMLCVRHLAVRDLRITEENHHLVKYMYMSVVGKMENKDNSSESAIKDKRAVDENSNNPESPSTLEGYKIKANLSVGELAEMEFSIKNVYESASRLSSNIVLEDLQTALQSVKQYDAVPSKPQVMLMRWVFSPIISPMGLVYMPEYLIKQNLAVLESVLWARGHHYLAILSSAMPITSEREMIVSSLDSKKRIPREMIDKLDQLFPYRLPQRGKKASEETLNPAIENIDTLATEFTRFSWAATTTSKRVESVLDQRTRRIPVVADIKTHLARLVIEIQTGDYI